MEKYGNSNVNPIILASQKGNIAMVNWLLELGYDPTVNNNQALIDAARYGKISIVNRLLQINE